MHREGFIQYNHQISETGWGRRSPPNSGPADDVVMSSLFALYYSHGEGEGGRGENTADSSNGSGWWGWSSYPVTTKPLLGGANGRGRGQPLEFA